MDKLCIGKDIFQPAQLEILGFFCVCVIQLLWCTCKLGEFANFLFSEPVISSSLWCLSSVLHMLWSCHRLPNSPLFSVLPKHLEYTGSHHWSKAQDRNQFLGQTGRPLKSQNAGLKLLQFLYPVSGEQALLLVPH